MAFAFSSIKHQGLSLSPSMMIDWAKNGARLWRTLKLNAAFKERGRSDLTAEVEDCHLSLLEKYDDKRLGRSTLARKSTNPPLILSPSLHPALLQN